MLRLSDGGSNGIDLIYLDYGLLLSAIVYGLCSIISSFKIIVCITMIP